MLLLEFSFWLTLIGLLFGLFFLPNLNKAREGIINLKRQTDRVSTLTGDIRSRTAISIGGISPEVINGNVLCYKIPRWNKSMIYDIGQLRYTTSEVVVSQGIENVSIRPEMTMEEVYRAMSRLRENECEVRVFYSEYSAAV